MSDPVYISIRLPLHIGPAERGEFWEDPLSDLLEPDEIAEVTGGGTMMAPDGGIKYCALEVAMDDLSDARLDQVQAAMTSLGAPKGTQIFDDDGNQLRHFGDVAVVGIGLDGAALPDSVYAAFNADSFSKAIVDALGANHCYGGSHAGKRYTFFYYHGPDGAAIEKTLRDFGANQPICQGAKYEHRA